MTDVAPQPRTYRPEPSIWWWVRKRSYVLFVLRELSSVFVAWFVAFLLLFVWSVARGEAQYDRFLDVAANPLLVTLNGITLAFLLLHTVTWFNLTPKAMSVRMPKALPGSARGRPVPSAAIVTSQWVGFAAVAVFVVWLVVG